MNSTILLHSIVAIRVEPTETLHRADGTAFRSRQIVLTAADGSQVALTAFPAATDLDIAAEQLRIVADAPPVAEEPKCALPAPSNPAIGLPLAETLAPEKWTPPPNPRPHTWVDGVAHCTSCGVLAHGALAKLTCGTANNLTAKDRAVALDGRA